jgi:ribosomal protein L11 methylase PrmA
MELLLESYQAFEPTSYLQEYYSSVSKENYELLRFFADAYATVSSDSTMLELGGGPGIYSLISASKNVKEIHFSDFLEQNRQAVQSWQNGSGYVQLWQGFFEAALHLEGEIDVDIFKIMEREDLLREKITRFHVSDAFQVDPIGRSYRGYYDIVAANFVAESITTSMQAWENLVRNICSPLKEGGTLILSSIQGAEYYCVNGKLFPAVPISQQDILRILTQIGFHPDNIEMSSIPAEINDSGDADYQGYEGMILTKARK